MGARNMIARRRFLTIAAVAGGAAAVGLYRPSVRREWSGVALGAQAQITLTGGSDAQAEAALSQARARLRLMERTFSLYDATSTLSRLNRTGGIEAAPADFTGLLQRVSTINALTGGLFDPTVQPLWRLHAETKGMPSADALTKAEALVGWDKVDVSKRAVWFERKGMAMTLNGIAQGYATDQVSDVLSEHGFAATLVNVGEFRANAGDWTIGVADAQGHLLETRNLEDGAIATSSPMALTFENTDQGHILDPLGKRSRAQWSTVSVEAADATQADGLSTALTLADASLAKQLVQVGAARRILLVDSTGKHQVFAAG